MTTYPNWFDVTARKMFERHLLPLAGKPGLRFLQLGAFTGDASVWMLDNVLTGRDSFLVDVDTWAGSDESAHDGFDWSDVEATYDAKIADYLPAFILKEKCTTVEFFLDGTYDYDFVYVDADHTPYAVLRDAVGAYEVLKVGGLVAFDDMQWVDPLTHEGPALAVAAVEACFRGRLQPVQFGAQAWFRKIA